MTDFEQSRERFERWAALDAPELPESRTDSIQVRLARWQAQNFGAAPDEHMTLGVVEELGEMSETLMPEEIIDGAGDAMVYLCQLLTRYRIAIAPVLKCPPSTSGRPRHAELLIEAGRLSHVVLKSAQKIRGYGDPETSRRAVFMCACRLVGALKRFLLGEQIADDLERIFDQTAAIVLARSWKANPQTGAAR